MRGLAAFLAGLAAWQAATILTHAPAYLVPGPIAIARAFAQDWRLLLTSLAATLAVTAAALLAATVLGLLLAAATTLSRWADAALAPWAVILQVTPIVAIAPLIIVWIGDPFAAMVVCATIVAFFPVYASARSGLASAQSALLDLFRLQAATRWQTLILLRVPSAAPFVASGLRVAGGLALVGAVVAEFVTGAGGTASGLAFRILEAGYRLQIPRMFAALALLALAGFAIQTGLGALERLALRRLGFPTSASKDATP